MKIVIRQVSNNYWPNCYEALCIEWRDHDNHIFIGYGSSSIAAVEALIKEKKDYESTKTD